MQDFLSEYISTLSTRRQERVYDLLRAAKTDKSDLDNLASKLNDLIFGTPISLGSEQYGGQINKSRFNGIYQDVINRFVELYTASNQMSLMLDTHTSVLTSEIKALEDEISAMQKTVDNYAFTLADNGSYDFSFIETFNDDTMRLNEDPSTFSDRSGVNFRSNEGGHVNTASGNLTLAPALESTYGLVGRVINSNCGGFVTSDTGLSNALNNSVGNGWRVAVSSPRPISATIGTVVRQGAQFELELELTTPSPSDSIVITPFAERPFEILKLEVISSNDEDEETKMSLVDGLALIDKPTDFGFPLTTVARVKMLINQPVYQRGKLIPTQSEEAYRKLHNAVRNKAEADNAMDSPVMYGVYRRNQKALVRTVMHVFNKGLLPKQTRIFRAQVPNIDFDPNRGPMSAYDFVRNDFRNYARSDQWRATSQVNIIFRRMIHEKVLSNAPELIAGKAVQSPLNNFFIGGRQLNAHVNGQRGSNSEGTVAVHVDGEQLSGVHSPQTNFLNYEYDLGFRNIQIGRGQRVFRGVFVSKSLPAQSDSGEVKLKVDDLNFFVVNSDRDSKSVTSIEYSVTNKSDPKTEADWVPIMPTNHGLEISGERVFFGDGGSATLRFPAAKQADFRLYKNGYIYDFATVTLVYTPDKQAIRGIRLPIGAIGPNDIFTVDYGTYGDQTIVNFEARGFERSSLASAFDASGPGETFVGTYNSRSIQLNNEVYVDFDKIRALGSYSEVLGFQGSYQPVTIIMSDGSVAKNQTNYSGLTQNDLSTFDSDQTAYIHSGRNIIFNRAINERFTVYYQYLPSNLKFRVILRVNDLNYVSPQVNSVQIKTKTRKSNAKRTV